MNPIGKLTKIFNIEKSEIDDNLMNTTIKKIIKVDKVPSFEEIQEALSEFKTRDYVEIYLKDESEENVTINKDKDNKEQFDILIEDNIKLQGYITLNILIKKDIKAIKLSVFNIESFINNFLKCSIIENLDFFNFRFEQNSSIVFVNYDNDYMFNTKSIIMINNDIDIIMEQNSRDEDIERCNSVSNFANIIEFKLLPDDFAIINTNMSNEFIERFYNIKILFSLLYIADYSSMNKDKIKLRLNGFRNKEYIINILDFKYKKKYEEFYKIYQWSFQDVNAYEKISLTRHVISMHCKYSDILDIDEKTFMAIKSNYNIYLKENVDKYVELKKQLTEFIMSTSNQINDIIGNFIGNFGKNIIGVITFIFGTIIANIVSDSPLDNIFTKDIVTILLAIFVCSIVYLVITIIGTYYRFKSYKRNYENLKDEYKDILNEQDINVIFKNDKEYNFNKNNVKKISTIFTILWLLLIFIATMSVILNYNSEYLKKVIDSIYFIIKR